MGMPPNECIGVAKQTFIDEAKSIGSMVSMQSIIVFISTVFALSLCSHPIQKDDEPTENKIRNGYETNELEIQVDVSDLGLFVADPEKYIRQQEDFGEEE